MKEVYKKIKPEFFDAVCSGNKNFEIRKDDDNIQVGDVLILEEFNSVYTGRYIKKIVTYVLRNATEYGLMNGYCIISFAELTN